MKYQYLHNAIKFSNFFHFTDGTLLLNIQNVKLAFWLNTNKIALNNGKTGYTLQNKKANPVIQT